MSYLEILDTNVFEYYFRKTRSVGGCQDKNAKVSNMR